MPIMFVFASNSVVDKTTTELFAKETAYEVPVGERTMFSIAAVK
jgi:hypothetical protein